MLNTYIIDSVNVNSLTGHCAESPGGCSCLCRPCPLVRYTTLGIHVAQVQTNSGNILLLAFFKFQFGFKLRTFLIWFSSMLDHRQVSISE